jgi:hypothetical protein
MTLPDADIGAVADADRRDQRGVGADERIGADAGLALVDAIIVAGDRARTDIGPGADECIADIGQVIDLGALADLGRSSLRRNCRPSNPGPDWRPAAAARTGRPSRRR